MEFLLHHRLEEVWQSWAHPYSRRLSIQREVLHAETQQIQTSLFRLIFCLFTSVYRTKVLLLLGDKKRQATWLKISHFNLFIFLAFSVLRFLLLHVMMDRELMASTSEEERERLIAGARKAFDKLYIAPSISMNVFWWCCKRILGGGNRRETTRSSKGS